LPKIALAQIEPDRWTEKMVALSSGVDRPASPGRDIMSAEESLEERNREPTFSAFAHIFARLRSALRHS
jgi:hypothetical protein